VFSFFRQAAISAFAENSASSPGLGCAESRCGGPFEEAHYAALREKSGNGFLSEVTPEGKTGIMTPKIDF
jgi:hypothetical protein